MKKITVNYNSFIGKRTPIMFSNKESSERLSKLMRRCYNMFSIDASQEYIIYDSASEYLVNAIRNLYKLKDDIAKYDIGSADTIIDKIILFKNMLSLAFYDEEINLSKELCEEIRKILNIQETNCENKNHITMIPCSVCSRSVEKFIKSLYNDRLGKHYTIKSIDWENRDVVIFIENNGNIDEYRVDMNSEVLYFACSEKV